MTLEQGIPGSDQLRVGRAGSPGLRYSEDVRADMEGAQLTNNSLARALDIKATTLKGYFQSGKWPADVVINVARVLGRNSDADLAIAGWLSAPITQQFLYLLDQLRRLDIVQANTPLFAAREPIADSPGAQLAAALVNSPSRGVEDFDIRLRKLMRGNEDRHEQNDASKQNEGFEPIAGPVLFADLLIVDLPRSIAKTYEAVKEQLLNTDIIWRDTMPAKFKDAVDESEAMFEEGLDYRARLQRDYQTSESAVFIIVPRLLKTRPSDPVHFDHSFRGVNGLRVTGLHFSGAADVGALVGTRIGFGFTAVSKLAQQAYGTGLRPYGGQADITKPERDRMYRAQCEDLTELLLDTNVSRGRRRVTALDEPEEACTVLERLGQEANENFAANPPHTPMRNPLIMLRISSERLMWVANRRALTRPGGGRWGDETALRQREQMINLQDKLTAAVRTAPNRDIEVFDVPESKADYNDQDTDTTDPDMDTYIITANQVCRWLLKRS